MNDMLEGFEFYKNIQGIKYKKGMNDVREPLSKFHKDLGSFTDKIFIKENNFILVRKGNWVKGNGTSIQEYLWNRYKPQKDDSNLVIYFSASTKDDEGFFISIGLVDDKLTDFEDANVDDIYNYLEEECKKITSNGFARKDTGWGERVFSIEDINSFESVDYSDLINKLKDVYIKAYNKFYKKMEIDEKFYSYFKSKLSDQTQGKYVYDITKYLVENYEDDKYIDRNVITTKISHEKIGKNILNDFSQRITKPGWSDHEVMSRIISWKSDNNTTYNQQGDIDINLHNSTNAGETKIKYKIVSSQIDSLKNVFKELEKDGKTKNTNSEGDENMYSKQPVNKILYGPPGTGKTYNTINKAIEIIKNRELTEDELKDRESLKGQFEKYKNSGQIEFITFHQSYGYEEFVEGIKAISPDDERNTTNELIYKVEDGIFKKLSKKAKVNYENSQNIEVEKIDFDEEQLLNDYVSYVTNQIKEKQDVELRDTALIAKVNRLKNGEFKSFTLGGSVKSGQNLTKDIIKRDYKKFRNGELQNYKDVKPSRETERVSHGNALYYFALYEKIAEFENAHKDDYEIIIQKEPLNNHILIIDEINRGNISKIFGELITLIEDSKRIGSDESVQITLPYSNEKFGVPSNLYILGTMNTADRSIALMDTALRRRFEFTEMMPDLEIVRGIEVDEIDIYALLEAINKRIEYLYDRDHTIGHAYFMELKEDSKNNITTLSNIFQNKIIPLLQEYFYDDWEKIRLVLGDNQKKDENIEFIKIKTGYDLKDLFGDESPDTLDIDDEASVYEINKKAFNNPESYIKVYEK